MLSTNWHLAPAVLTLHGFSNTNFQVAGGSSLPRKHVADIFPTRLLILKWNLKKCASATWASSVGQIKARLGTRMEPCWWSLFLWRTYCLSPQPLAIQIGLKGAKDAGENLEEASFWLSNMFNQKTVYIIVLQDKYATLNLRNIIQCYFLFSIIPIYFNDLFDMKCYILMKRSIVLRGGKSLYI